MGFIKYVLIIVAILAAVFLSQQAFSQKFGGGIISAATDWVMSNIYPKISGEVQKRGEAINSEVSNQKEKISENISEKIKNYFSGIVDSVFHPGSSQNCEPVQTDQSASSPAQPFNSSQNQPYNP